MSESISTPRKQNTWFLFLEPFRNSNRILLCLPWSTKTIWVYMLRYTVWTTNKFLNLSKPYNTKAVTLPFTVINYQPLWTCHSPASTAAKHSQTHGHVKFELVQVKITWSHVTYMNSQHKSRTQKSWLTEKNKPWNQFGEKRQIMATTFSHAWNSETGLRKDYQAAAAMWITLYYHGCDE